MDKKHSVVELMTRESEISSHAAIKASGSHTERNRFYQLDFFRGIFAIFVAILHYDAQSPLKAGYIAVDFFFILSGFVLTHAHPSPSIGFLGFTLKRVSRLYPLAALSMGVDVAVNLLDGDQTSLYFDFLNPNVIYGYFSSFLLLNGFGFANPKSVVINIPTWSISVELIAGFALLMRLKHRGAISSCMCLFVSLFSYLVVYKDAGSLENSVSPSSIFVSQGLLRGLSGILIGSVLYSMFDTLSNSWVAMKKISVAVTVLEILSLLGIMYIVFTFHATALDFIAVALSIIMIFLLATGRGLLSHILNNKVAAQLGAISFCIYLFHIPVSRILFGPFIAKNFYPLWLLPSNERAYVYILTVLAVASIVHITVEVPLYVYVYNKVKLIFPERDK